MLVPLVVNHPPASAAPHGGRDARALTRSGSVPAGWTARALADAGSLALTAVE
jgi:hypothetical protein